MKICYINAYTLIHLKNFVYILLTLFELVKRWQIYIAFVSFSCRFYLFPLHKYFERKKLQEKNR